MRTAGSLAAGASLKGDASRALAVPACAVLSKPSSLASRAERTSSTARAVAEDPGRMFLRGLRTQRRVAEGADAAAPRATASRSLTLIPDGAVPAAPAALAGVGAGSICSCLCSQLC